MRKITRILAFFCNLYSINAVADYQCVMKLKTIDAPVKTVAEKTYSIERGHMRGGSHGELYVEDARKKKKITLEVNAVMSGWPGEEDATFVIMRRETTRRKHHVESFSNIMTVKGDDVGFGSTFDMKYDVEIKCNVTGPTPE